MYNSEMYKLGSHRSVIRELFEFGKNVWRKSAPTKFTTFPSAIPTYPRPNA